MVAGTAAMRVDENPGKARLRLWIELLRASRRIETEIKLRLRREFNETLPRFDVMAALYRKREGMMMSRLSRHLMVSNGNVTGIIDRLVKDGIVIRSQRDGDRRTWVVRLTKTGIANFEKMAFAHEKWIGELLQTCGAQEVGMLHAGLLRLNTDWLEQDEKTD